MHAQTHPYIRMLCTIHSCTNLPKHAHIVHVTYMHQPTLTFARCARYIHDDTCTHPPKHPPTLTCAYCAWCIPAHAPSSTRILWTLHTCTTHLNIRMLWTKHTCKYLHNTRILCTIHACTNPPLHSDVVHDTYMHQPTQTRAYCARYIHAPTHPNICMLCTLHTWWYMHTPTHPNMRILCMLLTCTRPVKHAHIVNATYIHHPP